MNQKDIDIYRERYENRLAEFGYDPRTLGWGQGGRQAIRFGILCAQAQQYPGSSVLDIGCGFADMLNYLHAAGWRGRYTGVDIVPGLIEIARHRHPHVDLRILEASRGLVEIEPHDHVICCGALNARLQYQNNEDHIMQMMLAMWERTKKTLSVDFMSTHVDFQHPDAWHTNPAWILAFAQGLSRRVVLRADYMPFEFSLAIYRHNLITNENVYAGYISETM